MIQIIHQYHILEPCLHSTWTSSQPPLKAYFILYFNWIKKFIYIVVHIPSILSCCSWLSLPYIFCLQLPICRIDNHLSRPSSSPSQMLVLLPLNLEEKIEEKEANTKQTSILFPVSSHRYWHRFAKAKSLS